MASFYNPTVLLKTCPYNPNHKIKPSGYQNHITKCGAKFGDIPFKTCPFNATHVMPEHQYEEHVMSCKDSTSHIRSIYDKQSTKATKSVANVCNGGEDGVKDLWSEEYTTECKTMSSYDVLNKDKLTAEELMEMQFPAEGRQEDNAFTDPLFIQMMSNEEKKKYKNLCIERTNKLKEKKKEMNSNGKTIVTEDTTREVNDRKKRKNEDFRPPTVNPFPNLLKTTITGIGRGWTPGQK